MRGTVGGFQPLPVEVIADDENRDVFSGFNKFLQLEGSRFIDARQGFKNSATSFRFACKRA